MTNILSRVRVDGTTKIWRLGKLYVVADKKEVFSEDPGRGAPIMVYNTDGMGYITQSATIACALGEGEMSMDSEPYAFDNKEISFLETAQEFADDFLKRS